jgi:hypothetical protein
MGKGVNNMSAKKRKRESAVSLAIVLSLFILGGCQTVPKQTRLMSSFEAIEISAIELKIRNHDFEARFAGLVETAADEIAAQTKDPAIRENTLIWKMYAIPAAQKAIFQHDPLAALIDIWTLCLQMKNYFSQGSGKEAFGQWQSIALEASRQLESEIEAIAKEVTKTGDISGGQEAVNSWAEKNPIENLQFTRKSTTALFAEVLGGASLGISSAAFSMVESIIVLSNRMNAYATSIPKQARWQAEYILNKYLKREDLERGLDDFSAIAKSTERAVDIVEQTPELIQNERIALLKEINRQRIASMNDLTHERIAILDMMQAERIAVIEELRKERIAIMADVRKERIETMKDIENLATSTLSETSVHMKEVVDHFFLRLIQVLAVLVVLGFVVLLIFRRKGAAQRS